MLLMFVANHAMSMMSSSAAPMRASSRRSFHHFCFANTRYKTQMPPRYTVWVVRIPPAVTRNEDANRM
jgi:hypothetical protein